MQTTGRLLLFNVECDGISTPVPRNEQQLAKKLRGARVPVTLAFRKDAASSTGGGCGDHYIIAVNMTRKLPRFPKTLCGEREERKFHDAVARAVAKVGQAAAEV